MNIKIALSAMSIVSALALMSGTTFAVFTSAASNDNNTVGAGTMVLNVNDQAPTSTPVFTVAGMAPGSHEDRVIKLSNTGTVGANTVSLTSITHSTSTSPHDLGDVLTLNIYDNNGGTPNVIDGTNTLLGTAHITSAAWSNVSLGFGLAPSTSHNVIARVVLDNSADDTFQGANSTFTLNFLASQ